ncbi:MAG: uroporphyrinogen-III C-methyltransferase [Bacteroidota bacterium]|nr:uroporphyrinogen-III C-methyltransferase [Bacteroidota bacterium]
MEKTVKYSGKVILVGAGPGDPELLTVKAMRWLRQADVVITDRLVSDAILEDYVNERAVVLHVGKECRKGASTPQSTINELLVDYAGQGKLVVRLKGGDASLFSNILDELQTLTYHGIAYEIVPGVTAALGAAAYAGIPLTARGYSTALRLLTGYKPDLLDAAYWEDLAGTGDTLAFYMSAAPLDDMVEKLLKHGIGRDKWLAVIEQATTPMQRVRCCPIHEYRGSSAGRESSGGYVSPTLIIIGKVAALHERFKWLPDSDSGELYFKPVGDNHKINAEERA